jgi:hypothetical protein
MNLLHYVVFLNNIISKVSALWKYSHFWVTELSRKSSGSSFWKNPYTIVVLIRVFLPIFDKIQSHFDNLGHNDSFFI